MVNGYEKVKITQRLTTKFPELKVLEKKGIVNELLALVEGRSAKIDSSEDSFKRAVKTVSSRSHLAIAMKPDKCTHITS